jgi:two-component system, NtrC family, sensor kinase
MRTFLVFIWFVFIFQFAKAQGDSINIFHISTIPSEGILLDKGWKYQAGDNPDYATPQFDDLTWQPIDPTNDIKALPQLWKTNIGWLRLHLVVDSSLTNESIGFLISQTCASEIFLNGQLIKRFGKISMNPKQVQAVSPVQ